MDLDIQVKKNGRKSSFDKKWAPNDRITIKFEKQDDWGRSILEIKDGTGMVRHFSRFAGSPHEFETRLAKSKNFGIWTIDITIYLKHGGKEQISYDLNMLPASKISAEEAEEEERLRKEEEERIKKEEEDRLRKEEEERIKKEEEDRLRKEEEERIKKEEEDRLRKEEEERIRKEEEERIKREEEERLRKEEERKAREIHPSDLVLHKLRKKVDAIEDDEGLGYVQVVELNDKERLDLEIPVAEVYEMDKSYYSKLHSNKIDYIHQMLEQSPLKIKELTEAKLSEIKEWYSTIYGVYKNKDHVLRKEYRRHRIEYEESKRQLKTLKDSPRAHDEISVLSGVSQMAKEGLNEAGIVYVIDLLLKPLLELIALDIDPERPLLPKLWVANAKSHLGIK